MIQLKPNITVSVTCSCGGEYTFREMLWQGLHTCEKTICTRCGDIRLASLPVNQSAVEPYTFYPLSGIVKDVDGNSVPDNWYSVKLKSIKEPSEEKVEMDIEVLKKFDEVIILNTLDYIYGHSLLLLLNLQRIIKKEKSIGIIVLVQPMLKWLIPKENIAEIWTVKLSFQSFNKYYSDLTGKINKEISRFQKVWLSKGHLIPTNENIELGMFTGVKPFDFSNKPLKPGITFLWRQDPSRLWIRNIYLSKGFKKLGLGKILLPFQYLRVIFLLQLLKSKFGNDYNYNVAGLGKFGKFPDFIDDKRIQSFNDESERDLCRVYADSIVVVGIHGSSMLLPSAHAGMTLSLMPSKRWGNYAEDILFNESDIRLATFQRRIVPLNLCIFDLYDIIVDMITGRDSFIKKFLHGEEL